MEIIEYSNKYKNDMINLLEELQEYIVTLDPYHFNIINNDYRNKIYEKEINYVKNNCGKILLAIDNEKTLGLIIGIIEEPKIDFDYKKKYRTGIVLELIVTKKIRDTGVGSKLLKSMEEYFIKQGCYNINIDVFGYNMIGRNFYEKKGYHARMLKMSKVIKK